jgi:hypothetical protein
MMVENELKMEEGKGWGIGKIEFKGGRLRLELSCARVGWGELTQIGGARGWIPSLGCGEPE